MPARRLAAALVLVAALSAIAISRDRLAPPIEGQPSPTPIARPAVPSDPPLRALECIAQVALPEKVDLVRTFSQSPDGLTLAVARNLDPLAYSRALITRAPDPALQHIQLVDLRTLAIFDDIGAGVGPLWSGSGRYLSYHVPQGAGAQVPTDLIILDLPARREIARLRTTDVVNESVAWDGDGLVYLDGADVHRWEPAGDRIISTIPAAYLPQSGWPVISADGHTFVNAIGWDGTMPVNAFVIEAATGRATTLTGVRSIYWSRAGHRLLVRYDDHRELIDEDGTVRRADVPFVDTSVEWSPDGRQPLFADPIPASVTQLSTSRTLTAFDGRPTGIILPGSAHGSFDRDGRRYISRWWDGYSPPELRVYNCTPP